MITSMFARKRFIACITICAIMSILFAMIYWKDNRMIKRVSLPVDALTDTDAFFYDIDQPYKIENNILTLTGYAVRRDEDLAYINNRILLLRSDDSQCYEMNTIAIERGLTEYYNSGHDYTKGGLIAVGDISGLQKGISYGVYILSVDSSGTKHMLNTGVTVDL